jgi:hypothetical protein
VPLEAVANPAALVVSGEAEAFHIVFSGTKSNGVAIPQIGVFVSTHRLILDYRMGSHWSEAEVKALFEVLAEIVMLDPQASLSLEESVLPEMQSTFRQAWERWSAEYAA